MALGIIFFKIFGSELYSKKVMRYKLKGNFQEVIYTIYCVLKMRGKL